ncbi:hemicentin-1 [Nematostella vectensis]|uniref:hemicentin-1 n=1 Tax=Nematostella vectensis TaxID=45351 RepID=UPI00138FEBC2|nr:hemicentin-1 [Nematostella vectensis]
MSGHLRLVGILLCGVFALSSADVSLTFSQRVISAGKNLVIKCTISGEQFQGWYRGGSKIPTDSSQTKYVSNPTSGAYQLHLNNIVVADGGEYICRGNRGSKTFQLYVDFTTTHVELIQYLRISNADMIDIDVYGYPKPTFVWTKNGQPWNPNEGRFSTQDGGSVKFSRVEISDQGNYTCTIAVDTLGLSSVKKIEVITFEPPRLIERPAPFNRLLTVGYNTTFHCKAEGYPKPKYRWLNQIMREVDLSNPRFTVADEYFHITNIQLSDVGNYTCVAYNIRDYSDSASAEISKVYVRPSIKPMYDEVVEIDEQAYLDCVGEGNPLPEVRWIRDGRYERRQQITLGGRRSRIYIQDVRLEDEGRYTCEARNNARDQEGHPIVATEEIGLYIKSLPRLNKKGTPLTVYSYLGNPKPVFIRCRFDGYPFPNVTIWFDNKQIANGTEFAMFDIITNELEDFGDYLCWSWNIHGSKNVTVKLTHAREPSRPVNVKANVTCSRVTLTWDPPIDDGGMEIMQYVIEYDGKIFNTEDTYPKYYITNLKRDTMYDIKIWARNKMGKGKNNYETVSIITQKYCPPSRPIIWFPYEKVIDDTAFFLKWHEPESNGGDPDVRYKVVVSEDLDEGPFAIKTEFTALREYYVDELKFGQRYQLEVFSYNKAGMSEPAIAYYFIPNEGVTRVTGTPQIGPTAGKRSSASAITSCLALITILVTMATLT